MSDLVDRIMNKLAGLNDLVKRLRTPCSDIGINEELIDAQRNDAADEIERLRGVLRFWQEEFAKQLSDLHDERERLRAQVAMMREALKEISELPDSMAGATPSDYARGFMGGRYRAQMIARKALATGGERE